MSDPLDCLPCPCCGRCDTPADIDADGAWHWICECGAEATGDDVAPETARQILASAGTRQIDGSGDDIGHVVQAVLRALGLTNSAIRSLASGATLAVVPAAAPEVARTCGTCRNHDSTGCFLVSHHAVLRWIMGNVDRGAWTVKPGAPSCPGHNPRPEETR